MALSVRPFGDVLANRFQHYLLCPIQALNTACCSFEKHHANNAVDFHPPH
jgi:hypothetical protein